MSKTIELARRLERLHINNMYKSDFYWTWDKTDEELEAIFTVADALRDLRERNQSTRIFDSGLGISIFRDNSTRTRFSFASACNLLGLEVQDLDEKKSQIAHGETVRETANMVSFMADVIATDNHHLKGAAAVIDKDLASELLAEHLDADMLIILTAVEKVAVNFNKPNQKWLDALTPEEARAYIGEGQFAPGSMLPKVEAAVKFAESKPGRTALITLLEKARDGIDGKTGTRIAC